MGSRCEPNRVLTDAEEDALIEHLWQELCMLIDEVGDDFDREEYTSRSLDIGA